MMISILVPTRGRPDNVRRLVDSIRKTVEKIEKVEVLFYVDFDDSTFPEDVLCENIRIFRGPKLWLSLMQNYLFVHARGDILMYAADDIVFLTESWDVKVTNIFSEYPDKIVLVYPNDLGTYGDSLAIHGFLHRTWVESLKYWVAPGRGTWYDLWMTDVARSLDRLRYLEDVCIQHIHYRQGKKEAEFDETYKSVYRDSTSWNPKLTYAKLKRERRIDHILLREKIAVRPKLDFRFLLAELIFQYRKQLRIGSLDERRILTLTNFEVVKLVIWNFIKLLFRKRKL